jgi:VWFA-related protein
LAPDAACQSSNPGNAQSSGNPEVSTEEKPTTFKLRVNLVEVHVVVRDSKGNAVPGLKREDFRLYDQGKPQIITNFAADSPDTRKARALAEAKAQVQGPLTDAPEKVPSADHFIALMFDDTHLTQEDLMYTRNSVMQFLDGIGPGDRVGFASTSGQFTHDFSGDKEALNNTLTNLVSRPSLTDTPSRCPNVGYYLANLADTLNDQDAFQEIVEDTLQCGFGGDSNSRNMAISMARSAIRQTIAMGQADNNSVYDHVQAALRWLAGMPGERTMIFVSPGFSLAQDRTRLSQLEDLANKNKIPINTLDARGLYVSGQSDIAAGGLPNQPIPTTSYAGGRKGSQATVSYSGQQNSTYRASAQDEQALVLADFADGTGGTFFRHSNDLAGGMKRMATPPEYSYVLAFSPQNQKTDGAFHKLKVELAGNTKYDIKARAGYYAPRKSDDPAEQTRVEIEQAVFSRDEIVDMPMELRMQFFKKSADDAQLSVVTRLSVKNVRFQKLAERSCNKLTVVTVIFDNNGNYLVGEEKTVNLKLSGPAYEHVMNSGLALKGNFDLKPGKYVVRQVIRESEGAQMSARTGTVDIPN